MSSESPMPPLMELSNVTVVRNGRRVLHGITLRIEAGEHVAILGPNGSGKSTLIQLLTRELYPRYDGCSSIRLFGEENWRVSDLRSLLGIVDNHVEPYCARGVTGTEAVLSGYFGSVGIGFHHNVTDAMQQKSADLLAWLGIEHLAERPMGEMSSGEARRVMIARALVHSPRALVLDEPSNSLDVYAQIELRRTMSKLAGGPHTRSSGIGGDAAGGPHPPAVGECGGVALLLITHHLPDIVPEIERVILLRQGRIVGDGPKAQMLTPERLSQLFGCPVRITVEDGHYHLVS